jgi:hypothetical protein
MRLKHILGLLLIVAWGSIQADTLLLDGLNTDAQTASSRPSRGSSMTTVQGACGEPTERRSAVGDPPISRWEYPEFIVYFEYQYVIHTVVRH